jgi:hypothetical protein
VAVVVVVVVEEEEEEMVVADVVDLFVPTFIGVESK